MSKRPNISPFTEAGIQTGKPCAESLPVVSTEGDMEQFTEVGGKREEIEYVKTPYGLGPMALKATDMQAAESVRQAELKRPKITQNDIYRLIIPGL